MEASPRSARVHEIVVATPARAEIVVRRVLPTLSRRLVHALFADGAVHVNGRRARKGDRLMPGDHLRVAGDAALVAEPALPVGVLHVDADVVALDKPGGMPSHALDPHQRGTAAAFLVAHWPETATVGEPLAGGLVHRLDTGTSGILLAARTPAAWHGLRAAFAARAVAKRYLAVVAGRPPGPLHVDAPLAHDPRDRRRMRLAHRGDRAWPAVSLVRPLAVLPHGRALVEVEIRTGVTHQVRVHLAASGLPVIGDALYGMPTTALRPGRHALHAAGLVLEASPQWRATLSLTSPLPADLRALCV